MKKGIILIVLLIAAIFSHVYIAYKGNQIPEDNRGFLNTLYASEDENPIIRVNDTTIIVNGMEVSNKWWAERYKKYADDCRVWEYKILYNPILNKYKLQYRYMPLWEARMCCEYKKPEFRDWDLEIPMDATTLESLKDEVETRIRYDLLELIECSKRSEIFNAWKVIK